MVCGKCEKKVTVASMGGAAEKDGKTIYLCHGCWKKESKAECGCRKCDRRAQQRGQEALAYSWFPNRY